MRVQAPAAYAYPGAQPQVTPPPTSLQLAAPQPPFSVAQSAGTQVPKRSAQWGPGQMHVYEPGVLMHVAWRAQIAVPLAFALKHSSMSRHTPPWFV
jgi:hypothetical protein